MPPRFLVAAENAVWGGERRERALLALLRRHYESLFRRQWMHSVEPPHFYDHRIGSFAFAIGVEPPFSYRRGFFATEVIRRGDVLLDIGCGDGFFARRFFSPLCSHVDAIDVEASAIDHARRRNSAPNIRYEVTDAVSESFPRQRYDVIVLDGALGHFSSTSAMRLLEKVAEALQPDGVFVGSESLGFEGDDHLQFFDTLDDLASVLGAYFGEIELRSFDYDLPSGFVRREAYWRCAEQRSRLDEASWRDSASSRRSDAMR